MADDSGETTFVFKANTKPAEESLDAFGDKVTGIGKKIGAALAAYLSFSAIKGVLDKSIDAAIESDKAVKQLNNSLAMTGQFTEAASKSFQDYASNLQRATGISDEAIMRGASSLLTVGKVQTAQLNRVTAATLDFASAMQMDVSSAFDVMTKAALGNTTLLSKYKINVGNATTSSEKFAAVLGQIESRFGGLASKNVDPFTKLKVSADEAFESIGKLFTHSAKFKAILLIFSKALDDFAKSLGKVTDHANAIDGLIDSFFSFGQSFLTNVLNPIEKFTNFLSVGFMGIITTLLGGLTFLAGGIDKVFKTDIASSLNSLTEQWTMATVLMAEDAANGATHMTDAYSVALKDLEKNVNATAAGIGETFKNGTTNITEEVKKVAVNIGSALSSSVANAVKSMATSLVKGRGAFAEFGKVVLGMIGEMAVSVGQVLLTTGIGMLALGELNPFTAIAAGLGLIAIGSILSAMGGTSGNELSGGDTGGGLGATGSTGSVGGTMTPEEDRAKPQTGVTVVVQGNIFDSRETGLRIAEIINDSFDNNGTIIRAMA